MTDTLRNKLIQKGWVTEFHVDTLVSLIEEHYATLAKPEPKRRCIYNSVQIAECGGPCEQGPEHCDCGELWATEPEPEGPPSGEVAELVAWLRELGAKKGGCFNVSTFCANLTRAAELLEQLSPPQPIPVSERLPNNDLCWWFTPEGDEEYGWWILEPAGMNRHLQPTHWLPVHALPLPSGEVE